MSKKNMDKETKRRKHKTHHSMNTLNRCSDRGVRRCKSTGCPPSRPACLTHHGTKCEQGSSQIGLWQSHGGRITTVCTEQKQKTPPTHARTKPATTPNPGKQFEDVKYVGQTHHHVRVIDDGINVICGLNQGRKAVPQREWHRCPSRYLQRWESPSPRSQQKGRVILPSVYWQEFCTRLLWNTAHCQQSNVFPIKEV